MKMRLYELLETIPKQQQVDIYFDMDPNNYALDYHYYGRNSYISLAYDFEFYLKKVEMIRYIVNHDKEIVLQIKCS